MGAEDEEDVPEAVECLDRQYRRPQAQEPPRGEELHPHVQLRETLREVGELIVGQVGEDAAVDVVADHRVGVVVGEPLLDDRRQHPERLRLIEHPQQRDDDEVHPLHVADGGVRGGERAQHAAHGVKLVGVGADLGATEVLLDLFEHAPLRRFVGGPLRRVALAIDRWCEGLRNR